MGHVTHLKKIAAGIGVGSLLALTIAGVGAVDTVTQGVTSGDRAASVADLGLASVAYAHIEQSQNGSMTLTTDDTTGSNAGWHVTIMTSDFVWSAGGTGAVTGTDIPAANFSLTSAATPAMMAGQGVDPTDGPMVPTTSPVGTLDSARTTVEANAGFGNGAYTQALGVTLTIPEQSAAGTYTGTLTTTIDAAP